MNQSQAQYRSVGEAQRKRGAVSQAAFQYLAANDRVDLFERDASPPHPRGFELLRTHIDNLDNDQDKQDLEYVYRTAMKARSQEDAIEESLDHVGLSPDQREYYRFELGVQARAVAAVRSPTLFHNQNLQLPSNEVQQSSEKTATGAGNPGDPEVPVWGTRYSDTRDEDSEVQLKRLGEEVTRAVYSEFYSDMDPEEAVSKMIHLHSDGISAVVGTGDTVDGEREGLLYNTKQRGVLRRANPLFVGSQAGSAVDRGHLADVGRLLPSHGVIFFVMNVKEWWYITVKDFNQCLQPPSPTDNERVIAARTHLLPIFDMCSAFRILNRSGVTLSPLTHRYYMRRFPFARFQTISFCKKANHDLEPEYGNPELCWECEECSQEFIDEELYFSHIIKHKKSRANSTAESIAAASANLALSRGGETCLTASGAEVLITKWTDGPEASESLARSYENDGIGLWSVSGNPKCYFNGDKDCRHNEALEWEGMTNVDRIALHRREKHIAVRNCPDPRCYYTIQNFTFDEDREAVHQAFLQHLKSEHPRDQCYQLVPTLKPFPYSI